MAPVRAGARRDMRYYLDRVWKNKHSEEMSQGTRETGIIGPGARIGPDTIQGPEPRSACLADDCGDGLWHRPQATDETPSRKVVSVVRPDKANATGRSLAA